MYRQSASQHVGGLLFGLCSCVACLAAIAGALFVCTLKKKEDMNSGSEMYSAIHFSGIQFLTSTTNECTDYLLVSSYITECTQMVLL
jgi:hypothetical protein